VYPVRWSRAETDGEGLLLTWCADPLCNGGGPFFDLFPWEPTDEGSIPRYVDGVRDGERVPLYV